MKTGQLLKLLTVDIVTKNSAYRAAGTQSSGSAQPTKEMRSEDGGDTTM